MTKILVAASDIVVNEPNKRFGYYGRTVGDLVTILGTYQAVRIGTPDHAAYRELCWKCHGSGYLREYAGLHGGQCYPCLGGGLKALVGKGSADDVVRALRRREQAAKRRAAKRRAAAEAKADAYTRWAASQPELMKISATVTSAADQQTDRCAYSGLLIDLARTATCQIMTQPQIDLLARLFGEETAEQERKAQQSAQRRWLGAVGETIDFTGKVIFHRHSTNNFSGYERTSTLYILCDIDGNTVQWWRQGYYTPNVGDQYTMRGKVKKLETSPEHGKSTYLFYVKVIDVVERDSVNA